MIDLATELFPGQGDALSQRWRQKQLEYSWLLSQMNRYEDFWNVTSQALTFACRALKLSCGASQHDRLMEAYLHLSAFPDVAGGLKAVSGPRVYRLAVDRLGVPAASVLFVSSNGTSRARRPSDSAPAG